MITTNRNTTQAPLSATGRTGQQSIKFIPAPRVYIGPPDYSTPANVLLGFSNGNSPVGFKDLGIVEGSAKVYVSRSTNPIYVGVDRLLRTVYSQAINGNISFALSQFDDFALESVSGIAPLYASSGVYANYQLGGQDLIPVSLLLVSQNKLDGKEWQFYNPTALISFSIEPSGDAMVLKVSAILPAFSGIGNTKDQLLSVTILSSDVPGFGLLGYGYVYGG
jgi:hypothetical protein